MVPSVTIREYDRTTGQFLRSGSIFDSGTIILGNTGESKVFDFLINGVSSISSFSMSLTFTDNVEVSPEDAVVTDGAADKGNFGIETSSTFVPDKPITKYFSALEVPISISLRSKNISDYVYLNIHGGTFKKSSSIVKYRVNFLYNTSVSSSSSSSGIYPSSSSCSSSKSFSSSSSSISSISMSHSSSSCSSNSQCCVADQAPEFSDWIPIEVYADLATACTAAGTYTVRTFVHNSITYYAVSAGGFSWYLDWYDLHGCEWLTTQQNGHLIAVATVKNGTDICQQQYVMVPFVDPSICDCPGSSSSSESYTMISVLKIHEDAELKIYENGDQAIYEELVASSSSSSNDGTSYVAWHYFYFRSPEEKPVYSDSDYLINLDSYSYAQASYNEEFTWPIGSWYYENVCSDGICYCHFAGNFQWFGSVLINPPAYPKESCPYYASSSSSSSQ